ncbi:MAG: hypothetical protein ACREDM_15165, partial [Methylocella sp.]
GREYLRLFSTRLKPHRPLERFLITWNHGIDQEPLRIQELEHVLIEKAEQLFRDALKQRQDESQI